jgi:preprotein translocase subunit SecF
MEILRDTNIDFMKYRKFWVIVSLALVLLGFFAVFVNKHLNVGVDFAGGTQMTLKFRERPQVDELRTLLGQAGLEDPQIQRFGEEAGNEVIVKTRLIQGTEAGSRDKVVEALNRRFNQGGQAGKADLNNIGAERVATLLARANPQPLTAEAAAAYQKQAEAILAARRDKGLFATWDEVQAIPGVTPAAVQALRQQAVLGDYAIVGVESVGPQIGKELRSRGFWAVALSLLGMLVYIWIRFELRFGIGAVMACLHDVLVTLGLYALAGFEFNLTTVAAFLTLIGYSVNDTVVIFDRIRENMRKSRRKPLLEIMNESINQTLSRTILTGGSTLLALAALLALGGDVIRGFAFVMAVGILVGTYSSIYVASPFALLWEQIFGDKSGRGQSGEPVPATGAAAPRTPPASQPRPERPTPRAGAGGGRRR